MNTFQGNNRDAYLGLGVLGTEEKIGGVKSSDQQGNGLKLATPTLQPFTIQSSVIMANGEPAWEIGKLGACQIESEVTARIENTKLKPELGLGVYRPNLEDRKVGKVGMHMVIDGFPRALREVAKVMTWAADAKGYKLHDWRNLPDADVAFPAAEYRHQNDNCIMKAEGTPAIERTDHESNLLHAAHKVFNGLAELELILAGVIK